MTVSQSIISWLKMFSATDYWNIKTVNTDIQPAEASSYSLVKEPTINRKIYVSGKEVRTEHYTLMARLDSQNNTDRIDNNAWGELLEQWVAEQNREKKFPVVENATVNSVSVTTPFYLGNATDSKDSIYQLTIAINYMKG